MQKIPKIPKELSELIKRNSTTFQDKKISTPKSVAFLYTNNMLAESKTKNNKIIYDSLEKLKQDKTTMEVNDLYTESGKTLIKK